MSHFFQENYLQKLKTDPVMNAVLNSKQKMQRFNIHNITGFADPANPTFDNDRRITEPVRNPTSDKYKAYDENNPSLGDKIHTDITVYYRNNPKLYWLNMVPNNMYNLKMVNVPNPIFQSLNNSPINVHQSFSS